MGSQTSKICRQKDRVKSKVTSLLRWRLEATKRRRSNSSVSKHMLLKPDSEDGSINDRKSSTVSYRELDDGSVGCAKRAPELIEHPVSGNGDVEAMEKLTLEEKDHTLDEEIGRLKKERPTGLIFPGSPSFRFYLTENDKEEDCSNKDELPIKGSFSDAFEPRTSADVKELGSNMKKRGRRRMRFRRVIPMGRPVKNFLKGRS